MEKETDTVRNHHPQKPGSCFSKWRMDIFNDKAHQHIRNSIEDLAEQKNGSYHCRADAGHIGIKIHDIGTDGSVNETEGEISQSITEVLHQIDLVSF